MKRAIVLLCLLLPSVARAQVTVGVTLNADGQALANQLGITSAELASRIQDQVNAAYDATNVNGFIRSFTDATSFSTRGLGVDYVSMPKKPDPRRRRQLRRGSGFLGIE